MNTTLAEWESYSSLLQPCGQEQPITEAMVLAAMEQACRKEALVAAAEADFCSIALSRTLQ